MPTKNRTPWGLIIALPALLAVCFLILASTGETRAQTNDPSSRRDAFLVLRPAEGAPPSGGTISVGTAFTLNLYINTGTNPVPNGVTAAQSYLTFTSSIISVIRPTGTCPGSIPISTTITPDRTQFETELQNEVCNGPTNCLFRGRVIGPGHIAFASGALSNCPEGCPIGDFRVASLTLCAANGGRAEIVWQFFPSAPPERDTMIILLSGERADNSALFSSYVVNVSGPTVTPTVTVTRTPTRTPIGTPCPMSFTDVQASDYFYVGVRYLYCAGAISGYADGAFSPYSYATRAQAAKIMVLAEGWALECPPTGHFSDVLATHPFYCYIETAYAHNIITGYSDGTFRPYNNIMRGQMCKLIVLAEGWPLKWPAAPHFRDVSPTYAFYGFIETALTHGAVTGYDDGTFRPGYNVTRGQLCKVVYEALAEP